MAGGQTLPICTSAGGDVGSDDPQMPKNLSKSLLDGCFC
jgi:hypothetical protein